MQWAGRATSRVAPTFQAEQAKHVEATLVGAFWSSLQKSYAPPCLIRACASSSKGANMLIDILPMARSQGAPPLSSEVSCFVGRCEKTLSRLPVLSCLRRHDFPQALR